MKNNFKQGHDELYKNGQIGWIEKGRIVNFTKPEPEDMIETDSNGLLVNIGDLPEGFNPSSLSDEDAANIFNDIEVIYCEYDEELNPSYNEDAYVDYDSNNNIIGVTASFTSDSGYNMKVYLESPLDNEHYKPGVYVYAFQKIDQGQLYKRYIKTVKYTPNYSSYLGINSFEYSFDGELTKEKLEGSIYPYYAFIKKISDNWEIENIFGCKYTEICDYPDGSSNIIFKDFLIEDDSSFDKGDGYWDIYVQETSTYGGLFGCDGTQNHYKKGIYIINFNVVKPVWEGEDYYAFSRKIKLEFPNITHKVKEEFVYPDDAKPNTVLTNVVSKYNCAFHQSYTSDELYDFLASDPIKGIVKDSSGWFGFEDCFYLCIDGRSGIYINYLPYNGDKLYGYDFSCGWYYNDLNSGSRWYIDEAPEIVLPDFDLSPYFVGIENINDMSPILDITPRETKISWKPGIPSGGNNGEVLTRTVGTSEGRPISYSDSVKSISINCPELLKNDKLNELLSDYDDLFDFYGDGLYVYIGGAASGIPEGCYWLSVFSDSTYFYTNDYHAGNAFFINKSDSNQLFFNQYWVNAHSVLYVYYNTNLGSFCEEDVTKKIVNLDFDQSWGSMTPSYIWQEVTEEFSKFISINKHFELVDGYSWKEASGSGGTSGGIQYLTEPPTTDNADGLKFVVLDSEPETKYNGYLYIIKDTE